MPRAVIAVQSAPVPLLTAIKVLARPAQKGVPNPFKPGELMDRPAKPAYNKVKVRALKLLKDMTKQKPIRCPTRWRATTPGPVEGVGGAFVTTRLPRPGHFWAISGYFWRLVRATLMR